MNSIGNRNSSFRVKAATANLGLNLYLLFVVSWFLHFGTRFPPLGTIRFDLILVVVLTLIIALQASPDKRPVTQTDRLLRVLIVYSILTIPFVEWPGSVLKSGLLMLIKAVVFYYFSIAFLKTEADLRKFIHVFVACQAFRVLEPLYLHITQGYWGSSASMANWESLERLTGAPSDIVNPNGLAFIVCTILPFIYYMASLSWKHRLASAILLPASIYVLALTGSRSGMVGLLIIALGIIFKSRHRATLGAIIVAVVVVGFPMLSADMQDRYLSTFGMGHKNEQSAEQRVEGTQQQFIVALRKPWFGHGLGTSPEANANFTTSGPYAYMEMPAHDLYAELAEELGFVGLVIFLLFMKSIYSGFVECKRVQWRSSIDGFMPKLVDAMLVWLAMNFVFSFASYGLTSYEWYLFAGISVVIRRIAKEQEATDTRQSASGLRSEEGRSAFGAAPEEADVRRRRHATS